MSGLQFTPTLRKQKIMNLEKGMAPGCGGDGNGENVEGEENPSCSFGEQQERRKRHRIWHRARVEGIHPFPSCKK
jgi:hypothetical protein